MKHCKDCEPAQEIHWIANSPCRLRCNGLPQLVGYILEQGCALGRPTDNRQLYESSRGWRFRLVSKTLLSVCADANVNVDSGKLAWLLLCPQ